MTPVHGVTPNEVKGLICRRPSNDSNWPWTKEFFPKPFRQRLLCDLLGTANDAWKRRLVQQAPVCLMLGLMPTGASVSWVPAIRQPLLTISLTRAGPCPKARTSRSL